MKGTQISFGQALLDIIKGSTLTFVGMSNLERDEFDLFARNQGVVVEWAEDGKNTLVRKHEGGGS